MRVIFSVVLMIAGILVPKVRALDVSGEITGTHLWRMADATDTVRITGNVFIRDSASVTVAPGTVLRGYNGAGFLWRYNIFVEGTGYIGLHGTPDSAISFRNVCLEFGRIAPGGVTGISYCAFSDGWGTASLEFRNASEPLEAVDVTEMLIENCSFASGSYSLSYITSGARPTFRRCSFSGSDGVGIFIHGGGDAVIESCIFNGLSSAVCCAGMGRVPKWWEPVSIRIDHCTFYNINKRNAGFTTAPAANGYAITTLNYPGSLSVYNSIFQEIGYSGIYDLNNENADTGDAWLIETDYNMYYDLGGDPVRMLEMGTNSREADPLFVDAMGADFSLQAESPALSAGNDSLNMGAVQNTPISSVGALLVRVPVEGISIRVRQEGSVVIFSLSEPMPGELVVYDAAGNETARIGIRERSSAIWHGTADAGVYYARLTTDPAGTLRQFIRL